MAMRVHTLLHREASHSRTVTLLLAVVVAASAMLVSGGLLLLQAYERSAASVIAEKRDHVKQRMDEMWDAYRRITLGLGFNVLIVPEGQSLADFYVDGATSRYMPEEYATRLALSKVITVQHILPSLHQRMVWPEHNVTMNLIGVRGEVPRMMGRRKKPILDAVPKGHIVLGSELCARIGCAPGDRVTLRGTSYVVEKCYDERGNQDDISAWIGLAAAQRMLNKPGQINAILALECRCAADSTLPNIAKVRDDVARILPDTRVVEFMSRVLTRAEARHEAVVTARESLEAEEAHQKALADGRIRLASVLIPVLVALAAVAVSLLVFVNVRSRRYEIAILRTIGLTVPRVLVLLMGKALVIGALGAVAGACAGAVGGVLFAQRALGIDTTGLVGPELLVWTAAGGTLLAVAASWLPALGASTANPADVLHRK